MLQPIDQHVQPGGESLVAVVDPDVFAQGDQGGELVGGQGAEELVQLGSGSWVADALLVDGGGRVADGEADGVVDQQEEGQSGVAVAEPSGLQRLEERLGQGQGMRSEGSRVLRIPATGWASSTRRSRWARTLSWSVQPRA